MSLENNISQIDYIWKHLARKFNSSHDEWNDDVRDQFDITYWNPLHESMPVYLQSLEELSHVVQQAKQNIN